MNKTYVFIGGLHRSGTSLLHSCLRVHPLIAGFENTNVPEDEGQHLQTVFQPAINFGGPGKFAFDKKSFLDETSQLITNENKIKLLSEWEKHWHHDKPIRLEKSPPNLVRSRFLNAIFPNAKFIFMVRHPAAAGFATQKWSQTSIESLLSHWTTAHAVLLKDLKKLALNQFKLINFETFIDSPQIILDQLFDWLGVDSIPLGEQVHNLANEKYFTMWRNYRNKNPLAAFKEVLKHRQINHFGYSLKEPYFTGKCLHFKENWIGNTALS